MMRWVVVVLLSANVLYLGMELDRDFSREARNAGSLLPAPASTARLTLIRELPVPPSARSTQDTIATVSGDRVRAPGAPASLAAELVHELPAISPAGPRSQFARSYCLSYGPLPEQSQATGLDDWFRSHHARARIRHTDGKDMTFFWIYLAPLDSRQGAMQVLQELQSKGISDYRLVRRGNLENAISLGVFSSQSAVNRRLAELQDKGYKPVVVPYTGVQRVYWVDVKMESLGGDEDDLLNGYPSRYNSVPVNCKQIDIAGTAP